MKLFLKTKSENCVSRVLQMTRSDPDSKRLLEEILQEPEASSSGSVLNPVRLDWVRYWDRETQNAILLSRLQPSSEWNTSHRCFNDYTVKIKSNITFLVEMVFIGQFLINTVSPNMFTKLKKFEAISSLNF